MKIFIVSAAAEGPTQKAALDQCLTQVGARDLNLVFLTSAIPMRAVIHRVDRIPADLYDYGDVVYCVAEHTFQRMPAEVSMAWVRGRQGRGLITTAVTPEQAVDTLAEMMARRPIAWNWQQPQTSSIQAPRSTALETCAFIGAFFCGEQWAWE